MQLKDKEYLKRNILSVYYKHYEGGKSLLQETKTKIIWKIGIQIEITY